MFKTTNLAVELDSSMLPAGMKKTNDIVLTYQMSIDCALGNLAQHARGGTLTRDLGGRPQSMRLTARSAMERQNSARCPLPELLVVVSFAVTFLRQRDGPQLYQQRTLRLVFLQCLHEVDPLIVPKPIFATDCRRSTPILRLSLCRAKDYPLHTRYQYRKVVPNIRPMHDGMASVRGMGRKLQKLLLL